MLSELLKLKNIVKEYGEADSKVRALSDISIEFRKSEFVAILGHSGCGKTTLLNLIGGLDKYTSGEMTIAGRRTADFADADWDTYRNHSIGFVFQSYNLIPHQTVLANVELALTLSGVSKTERRERAVEALGKVGLSDQLYKKPNQMSGGQMQRVAIARALVNDPEILLADEPTGALDSENSVQIMEILKEISHDKLIIMVTHNPELAESYATRTVRLLDGRIISDSDPYTSEEIGGEKTTDEENRSRTKKKKKRDTYDKHTSMSFMTALSLSRNNLLTKKARTILTAFAGSIGIIGIALILSLSSGIQTYIDQVQEDTLSSYPITLEAESIDISSMFQSKESSDEGNGEARTDEELGEYVYTNTAIYDLVNSMNSIETSKNNLSDFKKYIEKEDGNGKTLLSDYASSVKYSYDVPMNIYVENKNGDIIKANALSMIENLAANIAGGSTEAMSGIFNTSIMSMYSGLNVWQEMLPPYEEKEDGGLVSELLTEQYDLLYGKWPESYDEVVLIVSRNNQINDLVLYSLGLLTSEEMSENFLAMDSGDMIEQKNGPWSFEEICDRKMRIVLSADMYVKDSVTDKYIDLTETDFGVMTLYEKGIEIKISGIVRANPDAISTAMSTGIGYTTALTEHIIDETMERDIVKAQLADTSTDVLTGYPFPDESTSEPNAEEVKNAVDEYLAGLNSAEKAAVYMELMSVPTSEYLDTMTAQYTSNLDRSTVEAMIKSEYPEYESMIADIPDETLMQYAEEMIRAKITEEYAAQIEAVLSGMTAEELAASLDAMEFSEDDYKVMYEKYIPVEISDSTYEENLELLGIVDKDSPSSIYIYAATFADKDEIANVISDYNATVDDEDKISYTDYVALLMSSITSILNAITYVLIAFVAISLVVSSIMIGIITYISVLERTKEIGILRAIGASKKDISRVFNAETLIVGFTSGVIGIVVTVLLCFPINWIIRALTDINNLRAALPWQGGLILVLISMALTLIAGLIPARLAAKKDPVVALRTE